MGCCWPPPLPRCPHWERCSIKAVRGWRDKGRRCPTLPPPCALVCAKLFLVSVNFAFLIVGWFLFGVGVWLHTNQQAPPLYAALLRHAPPTFLPPQAPSAPPSSPLALTPSSAPPPVTALVAPHQAGAAGVGGGTLPLGDSVVLGLMAGGVFVITLSFLGCCGACTDSVCFLCFYSALLIVSVAGQAFLLVFSPALKLQMLAKLSDSMRHQVRHEYNSSEEMSSRGVDSARGVLTRAWDELQIRWDCCGARGPRDYHDSFWFNHTTFADGLFVPLSCCVLVPDEAMPQRLRMRDEVQCQIEAILSMNGSLADSENVRARGCYDVIVERMNEFDHTASFLSIVISVQVLSFLQACVLIARLRQQSTDYAFCLEDD